MKETFLEPQGSIAGKFEVGETGGKSKQPQISAFEFLSIPAKALSLRKAILERVENFKKLRTPPNKVGQDPQGGGVGRSGLWSACLGPTISSGPS